MLDTSTKRDVRAARPKSQRQPPPPPPGPALPVPATAVPIPGPVLRPPRNTAAETSPPPPPDTAAARLINFGRAEQILNLEEHIPSMYKEALVIIVSYLLPSDMPINSHHLKML